MSPTASHTGRRADDRRGAEPRRGPEVKRSAEEYERELRRQELAIGRSLTSVLPTDRPARMRELAEARRVMSGAVRDLQRVARDLEADLGRYHALRSHTQREVLAYEAVAGEIEEVLLRWEARREQLSATLDRANRRQGKGQGGQGGQGRPGGTRGERTGGTRGERTGGARGDRATGTRGDRPGGTRGDKTADGRGDRGAGRDRATGNHGRSEGHRASGGRQPGGKPPGGRRGGPAGRSGGGGPAGRSGGGGPRPEPPRAG
jgi:hypothetical protein